MSEPTVSRAAVRAFNVEGLYLLPHLARTAVSTDGSTALALKRAFLEQGDVIVSGSDKGDALGPVDGLVLRPGRPPIGSIATLCEITGRPEELEGALRVQLHSKARIRVLGEAGDDASDARYAYELLRDPDIAEGDIDLRREIDALGTGYHTLAAALRRAGLDAPLDPERLDSAPLGRFPRVVDGLVGQLPLPSGRQREVLETLDLATRFAVARQSFADLALRLDVQRELVSDMQTDMARRHRETILREQLRAIQRELGENDPQATLASEYRARVKAATMPADVERRALEDVERLATVPGFSPEVGMLRSHLDWLVALPWNSPPPLAVGLEQVRAQLDADHYGLEKVKERVIDFLATQLHAGASVRNPILCLTGAPGTGKTSVARSIANALGRKYHRISLGGIRDEAEIRGHRRTYVGSMPGRIIEALKATHDAYSVIVLDEVDKIDPGGFSGDPAAALLEVLDPEQNREFTDHFIEAPYDLSRVMFICTANFPEQIPAPLSDRMDVVRVTGYTDTEKLRIARGYLVPKLLTERRLEPAQFRIDDGTILALIHGWTREAGVRDLERRLMTLMAKVVRVLRERGAAPLIDAGALVTWLGPAQMRHERVGNAPTVGASTGLYYSEQGGGTLTIEANLMPSRRPGPIKLTGSLGKTMQESAEVALTHLRANARALGLRSEDFERFAIHVHVPEGATPKDGPSAGLAIAAALYSAIVGRPVRQDIAMTGEIDTRGSARPIGGLKEKLFGAKMAGCRIVLIPEKNAPDLQEIPAEILEGLEVRTVATFSDVWAQLSAAVPTEAGA